MLLVTGITGYSGKYFLRVLINSNYADPIKFTVRCTSDTAFLDASGLFFQKITCDLGIRHSLDDVMEDVDEIIHIGSIFYSKNIVESALKHNVKRIICVHTTGIYSKYKSASSEYKIIEEDISKLIKSRLRIGLVILRPTMIYGYLGDRNISVFINLVDKFRVLPLIHGGKNLIQPVHGSDLGKAYYQVLMAKNISNGDYILSGGSPISMLDMMACISSYLGKNTIFLYIPLWLGVLIARLVKKFSLNKLDFIERVQRMGEDRSFSHHCAKKDFGYSPMRFEDGLKSEVMEYCNRQ